ncbi:ABC transporter ATP-binding protein [Desulfurispora thermophila]|uniref:ABC transporter ATP-binding protein n=1 Tax=Desulfurispora thermophila TaxID=265470 RepID=UPI00037B97F0|nr:ABC transporter ATP-binding protein [Desulfurispora thermophila]
MNYYFEIKDLKLSFHTFEGQKRVLDIEHLALHKGETYGLIGESGAGKTVLALTILRLLAMPPARVESGQILFNGEDLLTKPENEMRAIRGKKIAMIFQDPMSTLNPVFTVGEQLRRVIQHNRGVSPREAHRLALETIDLVKLPDARNLMNKYPHELSGGQRQRMIIAMALSCGPELLIADEPTRNLDVTIQAGILKLMAELQRELQVSVLFIANNPGLVSAVCNQVAILQQGRIVEKGTVRQVLRQPAHPYTAALLNAIPGHRREKIGGQKDAGQSSVPLLQVKSLKKYYPVRQGLLAGPADRVKAVDGVSFDLKPGEVLGLVGESGCGKTTLVNTLLRLEEPTAGQVLFEGKDIFKLGQKELRELREHLQIVFQDPFWSLNPRMLIKDIVGEPLKVHGHPGREELADQVGHLLEMVGLPREGVYKYPHEFSGGQRQRIAIARALALRPKLMVLDEPTSSIDIFSQAQILELLKEIKDKFGLTYILISHDLSVVNYMADKIAVMYLGQLVEYGAASEVFNNPAHPYTRALFAAIPDLDTAGVDALVTLDENVPSAINPPAGCRFHTRCPEAMEICRTIEPEMQFLAHHHRAACHRLNQNKEEAKA